jgi:membrane protease YdiL (CAAX protease family)
MRSVPVTVDRSGQRLRAVATVALIVSGAAMLAVRPALFATSDVSASERAVLLGLVYGSLALASVTPRLPRDRAEIPAPGALAVGVGALAVAWWTAGPVAPLAVTPLSVGLSTAAAVAEEALFRRLAYGHLRRFGVPAAIGATALLFALVHVPAYGVAALPVDLGAGLLFGWQRWASGTWTVSAATHAVANLLAVIR